MKKQMSAPCAHLTLLLSVHAHIKDVGVVAIAFDNFSALEDKVTICESDSLGFGFSCLIFTSAPDSG